MFLNRFRFNHYPLLSCKIKRTAYSSILFLFLLIFPVSSGLFASDTLLPKLTKERSLVSFVSPEKYNIKKLNLEINGVKVANVDRSRRRFLDSGKTAEEGLSGGKKDFLIIIFDDVTSTKVNMTNQVYRQRALTSLEEQIEDICKRYYVSIFVMGKNPPLLCHFTRDVDLLRKALEATKKRNYRFRSGKEKGKRGSTSLNLLESQAKENNFSFHPKCNGDKPAENLPLCLRAIVKESTSLPGNVYILFVGRANLFESVYFGTKGVGDVRNALLSSQKPVQYGKIFGEITNLMIKQNIKLIFKDTCIDCLTSAMVPETIKHITEMVGGYFIHGRYQRDYLKILYEYRLYCDSSSIKKEGGVHLNIFYNGKLIRSLRDQ